MRFPSIKNASLSSFQCSASSYLNQQIHSDRISTLRVFRSSIKKTPTFSVRSHYSASSNPFEVPSSSSSISSAISDQSNIPEARNNTTTKSVDDFHVKSIFVGGIPFFDEAGMVSFAVSPALFDRNNQNNNIVAHRKGALFLRFLPRSNGEIRKYDSSRGFSISIRAVDVGSILEIDAKKIETPVTIPGSSGHLEIMPGKNKETLRLKGTPKYRNEEDVPEFLEVEVSTGQFKTLQTLLFHVSPTLFGWQLLADPRLLNNFLNPLLPTNAMAKQQEEESFFDV